MKTFNWKFWKWPAQIRKWQERAERAEGMLAALTAELVELKRHHVKQRGYHRAGL